MKKLNFVLKLVVLAVFAGGLGLAGNGLNREVCAMENATLEDLEELLNNLQKEIENAGFSAIYEDLYERFEKGVLLYDDERETAIEQCNVVLKEIENYLNEYDNLGKDMEQFCNVVPERYYAVGNHLRKMRSDFYELREALSDKVWDSSAEKSCSIGECFELMEGLKLSLTRSLNSNVLVPNNVQRFLNLLSLLHNKFIIVDSIHVPICERSRFERMVCEFFDIIDNVDISQLDSDQKSLYWKIRNDIKKMADSYSFYILDGFERLFNEM